MSKYNLEWVKFSDFTFQLQSKEDWVEEIIGTAPSEGLAYHLVNAYTFSLVEKSDLLQNALVRDTLIPDGKPLSLILKFRNKKCSQIRGIELMRATILKSTSCNRHFFLGSSNRNLELMKNNAKTLNANIDICGWYSPAYSAEIDDQIPLWVDLIRKSNANVVWIGMGTPKQDLIAHELAKILPIRFLAVGAAFDFLAGTKRESPKFIRSLGLEWCFRFFQEPKRLGKRYLLGNIKFVFFVLRKAFK